MLGVKNPNLLFAQAMNASFKKASFQQNKLEELNQSLHVFEKSVLNLTSLEVCRRGFQEYCCVL